jgi:hypothetical protein
MNHAKQFSVPGSQLSVTSYAFWLRSENWNRELLSGCCRDLARPILIGTEA